MQHQQQRKEMQERSEMIQRMADTVKTKKLKPPVSGGSSNNNSSSKHVHSASLQGMKSSKMLISQSPQRNQVGTVSSQPSIQDYQLSKPFPYDQYNPKGSNSWTNESTLKKFADFQEISTDTGNGSSQGDRKTNQSSTKLQQQYQQPRQLPQEQSGMLLAQAQQQPERNARLTDLCAEDKKKIGELIMKLASEKEEKDSLQRELELKQQEYAQKLQSLMNENRSILTQGSALEERFKQNLSILASQQQEQQQSSQPQQQRNQVGQIQMKEQGENKHQHGQLQQEVEIAPKSTVVGTITTTTTNNKTLQPLAKQSNNNQLHQQQASSSEDEMEIAKKWRNLKRSRENSIEPIKPSVNTTTINASKAQILTTNGTAAATPLSPSVFSSLQQPFSSPQFSQLSPYQDSSTNYSLNNQPKSTQNPQQSQQQLSKDQPISEDLPKSSVAITKNKENNSNNSNSVDVEDIKKLNTYLMSKLRALNDPVKTTGKGGSIHKQGSAVKYQFDEDVDQEEKEEDEQEEEIVRGKERKSQTKSNRHTAQKNKDDQQVNITSKSSKQSKKNAGYSVPDSTIEGKFKQHKVDNHRNERENNAIGGYEQYQEQQFKQYNYKNHVNNQRSSSCSSSSSPSSSQSLSNSQQSCSSSDDNNDDNQLSELAATAVNMRQQLSRLTMLNASGLSTPCPEKISIEPYDLLASIKNYNNNYNNQMYPRNNENNNHSRHVNDSYAQDSNNKNTKKYQQQFQQQQQMQQEQSTKEQVLRREIEAAIAQLGPEEASQFLAEMLQTKQSAQKDKKKKTKQSNHKMFNDSYEDDNEGHNNNHRNDYSQMSQQGQGYNNNSNSSAQHKAVKTNQQGNIKNMNVTNESSSHNNKNTSSIHKKTFLDDDDADMISILNNGNDHYDGDNLFDLIENIEASASKYNKNVTQQQQQDYQYPQQQYLQQQQQQPQIRRF